jgi:hypothetical protein
MTMIRFEKAGLLVALAAVVSSVGCGTAGPRSSEAATPTAAVTPTPAPVSVSEEFFDDLSYAGVGDGAFQSGWTARDQGPSGPGPSEDCPGEKPTWRADNVSFVPDPRGGGNTLMRLTTTTDGTCAGNRQAEVHTNAAKFFAGTYAARVFLSNAPSAGTLGYNRINQTFFAMSDYATTHATTAYSELDFTEYLPNGGWGTDYGTPANWFTSWYTDEPPTQAYTGSLKNYEGWHTIVGVMAAGEVQYSVDGVLLATHGGAYYPRSPMRLHFNLWWVGMGYTAAAYTEDVDWVYYAKDAALTAGQVEAIVAGLRQQGLPRKDGVP